MDLFSGDWRRHRKERKDAGDEHRTNIPAIAAHMTRAKPVISTRRVLHVAFVLYMSPLRNTVAAIVDS
ncbi:hypothetical protein VNO78_34768 [Psophocarpus tetragonolobus]|uniref:Uncharacterized protein n=1 Tax=Psophocarpus tetragonolobus TaxID=3891 RepID=A0AAN9NP24_PSOTE